ncbi:MAG: type II toxin-antitoxin system RelE/ParE family toxin [Fibromonadaceae bacterium]|jgi:plasmid stabilization system protein ParE|nr:type II toxin-antitoxin system RelE/ParE family toxin [Fibromonadaceae bacterium]
MIKKYNVNLTKGAEIDLEEIVSYIANDSVLNALRILERLQNKVNSLNRMPERGRYVPELLDKNIREYKELIENPWRIFYRIEEKEVYVLAIIDGRRNVQDILIEKLIRK